MVYQKKNFTSRKEFSQQKERIFTTGKKVFTLWEQFLPQKIVLAAWKEFSEQDKLIWKWEKNVKK